MLPLTVRFLLTFVVLFPTRLSSFLFFFFFSFAARALINRELPTLLCYGLVYFVAVPIAYLILPLYAYANILDTSWGTRDTGAGGAAAGSASSGGWRSLVWCVCSHGLFSCGACSDPPPPEAYDPTARAAAAQREPAPPPAAVAPSAGPQTQPPAPVAADGAASPDPAAAWDPRWPRVLQPPDPAAARRRNEAKQQSLNELRWGLLAAVLVLNLVWLVVQLTVFGRPELRLATIDADIFSLAFLFLFGVLTVRGRFPLHFFDRLFPVLFRSFFSIFLRSMCR